MLVVAWYGQVIRHASIAGCLSILYFNPEALLKAYIALYALFIFVTPIKPNDFLNIIGNNKER
jgi:hypothetical protein